MKLSVFAVLLQDQPFDKACEYLASLGVQAVEIGCGGFPGKAHCDPKDFLAHPEKIDQMKATLEKYHLEIAALSTHGNAVHPDKAVAKAFHEDFENAVLLAEKLGVDTVVTFSGCPGGCPEDKTPNWVTCPWPDDFTNIVNYQWNEVLIPYWKKEAEFVKAHGVKKIAFEMHPGFCVYNPETLMKLRNAVGPVIGANFDPSHLFWQGVDPVKFLKAFPDRIYHCHIKDAEVTLDGESGILSSHFNFGDDRRGWDFRSPGHGQINFEEIIRELNRANYQGPLSVEWEDAGMDQWFGAADACAFTRRLDFAPAGALFDAAFKK